MEILKLTISLCNKIMPRPKGEGIITLCFAFILLYSEFYWNVYSAVVIAHSDCYSNLQTINKNRDAKTQQMLNWTILND